MTDVMEFDVVIVGAGPAGLSAAIRIKQLAAAQSREISVAILEKGSEVGAHLIAGAVLEPTALNELIPDWKEKGAPLTNPVLQDEFLMLGGKGRRFKLPTPPQMHNEGNYIISIGNFARWLATQAEALGVQIFPGFPAADLVFDDRDHVAGVKTGEFGVAADGSHKDSYQPAMELRAKYTLLGEGCRGSLTKKLEQKYKLMDEVCPKTYGIGLKEIWQVKPELHQQGKVVHTIGWPMDEATYGGGFIYHMEDNQVAIGYVVGLDYRNPYLNPYQEFQRFKTHKAIAPLLEGGKRIAYGARALNEGGVQAVGNLQFPGGAIIGCAGGLLNVPKIKGIHTAMKSGMIAAEAIVADDIKSYMPKLAASWVYQELYRSRNIRPGFRFGLLFGLVHAAIDTYIFRGRAPWTLRHTHPDHASLNLAKDSEKIEYPKPDGKLTFDLMSSVFLSNTNHEENQPCHLQVANKTEMLTLNYSQYASPETRYCPAGVYEIVEEAGSPKLRINAQNCVHCKTCDIKDPGQNINWVTPEGGGGPTYGNM